MDNNKKRSLLKKAVATTAVIGTVATGAMFAKNQNVNASAPTNHIQLASGYKGFKIDVPMAQFPVFGTVGPEPLWHESFHTSSNAQAWCTNYSENTPNAGSSTTSKHPANSLQFHVLLNAYPLKSPSQLGVDNKMEALGATQMAVWVASGNFSASSINFNKTQGVGAQRTTQAQRNRVKAAMYKILDEAKKDKRGQGTPKLDVKKVADTTTNSDGSTTTKYKVIATKNYDLKNLKLTSLEVPSGTKVTQDGKDINKNDDVKQKDEITVTTPAQGGTTASNGVSSSSSNSNGNDSNKIHLGFQGTVNTWTDASFYNTVNNGEKRQNVLVQSVTDPGTLKINAGTDESTPVTEGGVSVHKVGAHDDPLENIKFDLLDSDKKLITSGTTNEDGNVHFNHLKAGNYYVREADTDSEHEVDHALHDVSFTAQDAQNDSLPNITVQNDEITDNPYIKSAATEVGTGSRYIDAKNTKLQDELALENLDGTHSYKVVDTLMDTKTGNPASIDGKPVTATANITAHGKSGEKVEERTTMNFDTANFKGLQGKRYAFQAKVYKVSDYDLGKELATEFSLNDTNQSITVNKPVITTKVRSGIAKDSTEDTQRVNPSTEANWIDNVTVNNLVKDHDYTSNFKVMVKDKNGNMTPLKVNGKDVTASKDITADNAQMNFDVDFGKVDTTELKGKDLVIYSNVTPKEQSDDELANHNVADDKNETIHVTNPQMETQALIDDDNVTNPNHSSRLLDRVSYSDVAENQPLTLSAIASDKDKRAIVATSQNDNNYNGSKEYDYLMGKLNFTPTSDNGTEDVQLQKVAVGNSNDTKDINSLKKDISSASVRTSMNQLNPVNPGDVQIDSDNASQKASNDNWKTTLAGKLGYIPADNSHVYDIDTTSLKGQKMVMFEDLHVDGDKNPANSHADTNDQKQTVTITNPKIYTQALLNNHKLSNPSQNSKLSDKVRYEDVATGHALDFSALATNQQDGTPITIKSKTGDKTYNLMGRARIYPTAPNGSVVVPLQEVLSGNPVNNNSGNPVINNTNVDDIKVENVKDDRTMQSTQKAIDSISSDGSTNINDALDYLHGTINYVDSLVYQSNVGMPNKLVTSLDRLTKVIGDGKQVNVTDLINATKEIDSVVTENVNGGTLITNDQYEAVKNKQQSNSNDSSNNTAINNGSTTTDSNSNDVSNNTDYTSENSSQNRVNNNHIQVIDPRVDSDSNTDINSDKYNIDTTQLRGKTMTMFEDMTSPQDNSHTSITTEANTKNTDQSVRVTKPSIQTMQTISDQKTIFSDSRDAKIVDKVQFKDFAPNEQATLTAVDMDKGTKEAAKINESFIVGRRTFTPRASDGTVKVFMSTRREEPENIYMVKQLRENGLPSENADTTEQAHSTKTADQLLNMNNGSISDSANTSSNSNGQTDTNDTNTVDTNRNGDNGYESQADNSVGSDNVDDHMDTSETSTDLSWLDKMADGASDPTNREFNWTAFETAQTGDGTVITEHKDMSSTDQTVTIKTPNSNEGHHRHGHDKIVINNSNGQQQANGNNHNNNGSNSTNGSNSNGNSNSNGSNGSSANGGSSSNGSNGSTSNGGSNTNGSNSNGSNGSTSNGGSNGGNSTNGTNTNNGGSGSSNNNNNNNNGNGSNPQLAQTGASNKYSSNPVYNFFFGWMK